RVRAGARSGARRRAARVRVHRHFDQSGARHRGVSGLVRGRPAQEGRVPPVPHHRRAAGRLRGGARGGDAVPGAAHRRNEAAPGPDGDRRRQGSARRRPRRGACARPGDPAHREPREARGRSVPAGAVRAAAAVAPQPVAQAAAARPRRGASLRGELQPQAARPADHHLRAADDSRDRAEPAPGAAGAVRLAGGRENRDAGRDRRGARLLDDPGGADPRPVEGSGVSLPWSLQCSACGKTRSADGLPTVCECGGPYLVRYTAAPGPEAKSLLRERRWTMWRYREWLPLADGEAPATLGEGGTPLLAVPRLAARYGLPGLRVKDEATNPTGSFKARGLAAAVTRAGHAGARAFVVPTAGNAGVALAAYAARAGVPARVYAPASTPPTILSQIRSYGGDLVLLDGHIGDCGAAARAYAAASRAADGRGGAPGARPAGRPADAAGAARERGRSGRRHGRRAGRCRQGAADARGDRRVAGRRGGAGRGDRLEAARHRDAARPDRHLQHRRRVALPGLTHLYCGASATMRIAILDPAAGISGDMTLGALLSLGAPAAWLEALPRRLGGGLE